MFTNVTTLTEFILKEERKFKDATGSFTLLMTHIENAAKIIASHITRSGLVDILGRTGETNVHNEEVQKLDVYSNQLLVDTLIGSGQTYAVASEELKEPVYAKKNIGEYVVFFDPLDGSSNIDVNVNIGTIFSIYRKSDSLLQPGRKQVAAGYIMYGPSVMFVYSCGNGVNGFTLDPSIGSFLLSNPDIKIPESKSVYSINEGNAEFFEDKTRQYLESIKKGEKPYKLRYIGTLVADVHRTLMQGGIFLYPPDKKSPNGKLRLMYEVNPMSFLVEQAGGAAISNSKSPLDITPSDIHQRVPVALGSKKELNRYQQI
jgi:fructose-1,6-bisphosphatase I